MLKVVHRSRPAMGTLFEAWLVGEDEEHLAAVGEAALEEIARVEQLLSRFDPRSEISRLNRTAAEEAVLCDVELFGILEDCRDYWQATDGAFDITATSPAASATDRPTMASVELDPRTRTARFTRADVRLDLGAFGKGYALDSAKAILAGFNVERACLHGGTSSVLALSKDEHERPWQIAIRDPWASDAGVKLAEVQLAGQGYSCSAVFGADQHQSDIIDPRAGRPLAEQCACCVLAETAAEAEIYSTALLSMGKERAATYTLEKRTPTFAVGWIERQDGVSQFHWL